MIYLVTYQIEGGLIHRYCTLELRTYINCWHDGCTLISVTIAP